MVLLAAAVYWVIYIRPRRAGVETGSLNPLGHGESANEGDTDSDVPLEGASPGS